VDRARETVSAKLGVSPPSNPSQPRGQDAVGTSGETESASAGSLTRQAAAAVFSLAGNLVVVVGEWGTILAVPMLVIVRSVADHVERLRPVGRLMAP
jgi:hypothetical protein